jgi:hypothetical protein
MVRRHKLGAAQQLCLEHLRGAPAQITTAEASRRRTMVFVNRRRQRCPATP